jgi:uncharacterized membrane protein YeaQ/YmgE (transglycosylase-associated protein family)
LQKHDLQIARPTTDVKGAQHWTRGLFHLELRDQDSFLGASAMSIIAAIIIGAIAGWLAGQIVRGAGFGLVGNIVIGILGSLVAGWILPQIGVVLASGTLGAILDATIGAVIILIILSLIRRA